MTQEEFNAFCATLPHTFHVVQWGGADVWKVGVAGKNTNKVFVIGGWNQGTDAFTASFKCGEIAFEMLRDAPGCRPAPYLASRGMKWIQRTGDETISSSDMQDYLRESHRLASLNLTKKLQIELGLNQEKPNE
jgi:predicted DNA-binding protein (MmcQ/YjbR family)